METPLDIHSKIIANYDDLTPHLEEFARLRGDYYLWNIQSRYEFNQQVFEKNLQRRNVSLDELLAPYRQMAETGIFPPAQIQNMKDAFVQGQWLVLVFASHLLAGCARLIHRNPEEAELHSVYVSPQYRGNGIGRRMVKLLLQIATTEGYQDILLDTMSLFVATL